MASIERSFIEHRSSDPGTYIVQPGDTFRLIAERLHIPIGDLLGANPMIYNINLICTGQSIRVPATYRPPR